MSSSTSTAKVEVLESRDPRTGELLQSWPEMSEAEVASLLEDLHSSFAVGEIAGNVAGTAASSTTGWGASANVDFRLRVIATLAEDLRNSVDECAALIHREMGKNVAEARAEVLKCALMCDYFVQNGKAFVKPVEMPPLPGTAKAYYVYQPLGVIFAIMPWNFPFWQVIRAVVPNFVAGNTMVLKHAPNCVGCGKKIEEMIAAAVSRASALSDPRATLSDPSAASDPPSTPPLSVFRTAVIPAARAERVLRDPRVQGVCLTGSEGAGRAVAALAGSLLKKCVVELGGNDGYLVLKNADIDRAVDSITKGRLTNTGQVCIAPKRIICEGEDTKRALEAKLVAAVAEKQDGRDFSVLVNPAARAEVARKVQQAIAGGARVLCGDPDGGTNDGGTNEGGSSGGSAAQGAGAAQPGTSFYNPVVLTDMSPSNPAADTEIFGPVFTIMEAARDEAECVQMCNNSHFGLGSAVFVDPKSHAARAQGERVALQLQAGMAWVNDFVKSDPSLPFGGVKASGIGRECGPQGVHEFCNLKTVVVSAYAGPPE